MIITKLPWCGLRIESGNSSLLIDPLAVAPMSQEKPLVARLGQPLEQLFPLTEFPSPVAILITHIHPDHFDAESIRDAFGANIPVLVPAESIDHAQKLGLTNVTGVNFGDSFTYGELKVTATYSVDGYGTPQVAWVVEGDEQRVIHCGDTLWHGFWWRILREIGRIDVACLPVNGPLLEVLGMPKQCLLHASLTPEEAVEAAAMLAVKRLIPIHYGTFNNPPFYVETSNLVGRLQESAKKRNVNVEIMASRDTLDLSSL